MKRTPLRRRAKLRAGKPLQRKTPLQRTSSMAASDAQRAAVAGRCASSAVPIGGSIRLTSCPGLWVGVGTPCCVPVCRADHRRYDRGEPDLLPYLEPAWRAQLRTQWGTSG